MKKLLIFLFVLCSQTAISQVYQLMPQYGYDAKRMNFDSTLSIPTFCGVPSLKSNVTKKAAIAYDSCNKIFYYYDPKLLAWDTIKGGGASSIDTTSLSNRINQRIDSLRRSNDSVYARKNGLWVFQYKDSVGSGGGVGTLQEVTDNGNSTYNSIEVYGGGSPIRVWKDSVNGNYSAILAEDGGVIARNAVTLGDVNSDIFTFTFVDTMSKGNVLLPYKDTSIYLPLSVNGYTANTSGNITLPLIDSLKRSTDSVYARKNGSWVFQYKDSIGGAGSGFVPYTGATQDVDLGTNKISAHSVYVEGTNGNGHLHLKHQNADATATGQSTSLFANSVGDLKWKNDNLHYTTLKTQQTADRVYTFENKSYTLGDSADVSERVKFTDTATMLSPYLRKVDTASLSNRINLKVNISDTSSMLSKYMRYNDSANLVAPYLRKADTTAMLTPYQRKYTSSYSMNVNNTNAGANATETTYKHFASATYSGTITWTGTTAPSGSTSHTYSWEQVGKLVTLRINLIYSVAGSALTSVSCTLPSDCPTPEEPSGIGAASDVISYGSGVLTTSLAATGLATIGMGYSAIRVNSADNGYDIVIARASINARYAYATIQYFAQ